MLFINYIIIINALYKLYKNYKCSLYIPNQPLYKNITLNK